MYFYEKPKRKNDDPRRRSRLILLLLLLLLNIGAVGVYVAQYNAANEAAAEGAIVAPSTLACTDLDGFISALEAGGDYEFLCSAVVRLPRTITVTRDTTLMGSNDFTTMISGRNALDTIIMVESGATLTLNNIHVIDSRGYGIVVQNGATLITERARFSGHGDEQGSGAAVFNMGTALIASTMFEDNNSYHSGGGIINAQAAQLTVSDSIFRNNIAGYDGVGGGAGLVNEGDTTITGSTFISNMSMNSGGAAIDNMAGTLTITGTMIERNTAATYGAGIRNSESATLTMTDVRFLDNKAPRDPDIANVTAISVRAVDE